MYIEGLKNWNIYFKEFAEEKNDVYFNEKYVKLYENENTKPVCFIYNRENCYFMFPYLLRSFNINGRYYYDFETPYGYGGPLFNTNDKVFVIEALNAFYQYGKQNNYVAGFVRFHPLLNNSFCFETIGQVINDRNTVAINLNIDIDAIWMNEIHTKNRNIIKKGIKNGLTFIADYEYKYLEEFIELYNHTMNKLNADSFYYFDRPYYTSLKRNIKNSFLGVVLKENKIISIAVFLYSGIYGHYHLSGSDNEYLKFCPNNFMIWEAAKELKKHGVKTFHLGGGTDSDEHNSLFEFKRKFSSSVYSFQIGKIVFNPFIYNSLCFEWEQKNPLKREQFMHHLLKYKY
jgi:hypothetical protein